MLGEEKITGTGNHNSTNFEILNAAMLVFINFIFYLLIAITKDLYSLI